MNRIPYISEARFTSKVIAKLKCMPEMKYALIWKVNDRISAGRPDLQIILRGKTTYFEFKVWPHKVERLQMYYLARIGWQRAHVVRYDPRYDLYELSGNDFVYQVFKFNTMVAMMVLQCL